MKPYVRYGVRIGLLATGLVVASATGAQASQSGGHLPPPSSGPSGATINATGGNGGNGGHYNQASGNGNFLGNGGWGGTGLYSAGPIDPGSFFGGVGSLTATGGNGGNGGNGNFAVGNQNSVGNGGSGGIGMNAPFSSLFSGLRSGTFTGGNGGNGGHGNGAAGNGNWIGNGGDGGAGLYLR